MARKTSASLGPRERAKLKDFASKLRKTKPGGWSVVFSGNEIVVRSADRGVGKFSVSWSGSGRLYVAFFSRELNYWNKRAYFTETADFLAEIRDWMVAGTLVPTKGMELAHEVRARWLRLGRPR